MAGELNGLQKKIKSVAPQALFTHCYAHKLNLVLQDSYKQIRECRIFFSNVSGFSEFFTKSTKRTNLLDSICKKRLPSNSETRWNFKSRVVNTLFDKRINLIEVFDHIIENLDQWDDVSIRESIGFKKLLTDFDFVFLLHTFHLIFTHTETVFSLIQNSLSDITYRNERIISLVATLKNFRNDNYFNNFYLEIKKMQDALPPSAKRHKTDLTDNLSKKLLFFEILDLLINIYIYKFDVFSRNFPEKLFNSLINNYRGFFNNERLKRELQVLYSDKLIFSSNVRKL
jgi:hypothetical protein